MLFCCNIFFADQTPQLLEEERMAGSIQSAGGRKLLFGVLQIEDDRHITVKNLQ